MIKSGSQGNSIKYRFLLYISHSYSIPIGLPLQKEIQARGYQIQWFCDRCEGQEKLKDFDNVFDDIEQVLAYKPHIVLVATNEVADFISGLKVQIFHGFNAQKRFSKRNRFSHFNIRGLFDLYCTQGPSTTKYFKQLAEKHQHFNVVETGWPKMDTLFPIRQATDKKQLKTIVIASTFSKRLSLAYNDEIYTEIARLIASGKYNFLMVLHPKIPLEIKSKWQKLICEKFQFYDTTDLNPIFKKADRMLADSTSAIQEFILQRKPVIAFANNAKPDYLINIDQVGEIESAFDRDITESADVYKKIDAFIQQLHPYFDGKSSARVIDASIECLHANKAALKNKPLNLLRKYKIRKRLAYFTLKSYNRPNIFED
ncbi:MAG: CDP-glycerol glycerophosphotransferase family protein [Alcanivoracaceae bacterium]|nr:CDP-glycerol glycerophosphotransferase family protein [Alcanivoracaceae bacterium]